MTTPGSSGQANDPRFGGGGAGQPSSFGATGGPGVVAGGGSAGGGGATSARNVARPDWWAEQDDLLISITDRRPLPTRLLRALPPYRALMIARIACQAGVGLEQGDVDQLAAEAARVGGGQRLGDWWRT